MVQKGKKKTLKLTLWDNEIVRLGFPGTYRIFSCLSAVIAMQRQYQNPC